MADIENMTQTELESYFRETFVGYDYDIMRNVVRALQRIFLGDMDAIKAFLEQANASLGDSERLIQEARDYSAQAIEKATNVETEFNEIIGDTTGSDAMSVQASVDAYGVPRGNLKERIDRDYFNTNNTVKVEVYDKQESDLDDTERLQRAIDEAAEFSTVELDPKVQYTLRNVMTEKALNINLNGASITRIHTSDNKPLFHFKGSIDDKTFLTADAAQGTFIITVPNASTLYKVNDYVVVGDNKVVPSWDGNGYNYTGQSEISIITKITGDSVMLAKPTEFAYSITNGAYIQKISKLLKSPKVYGSGSITEVDPGVESASAEAGKGHIVQFEYAILPEASSLIIDGWQLHAINFYRCIHGLAHKNQASNPFRPQIGGHGYVVKYDNAWGGSASENVARFARHLVDWSRSYDGHSSRNFSYMPYGVSFYMHGLGSKRVQSEFDKVESVGSASEGWAMGNPSFAADYNMKIVSPMYRGDGTAIGQKTKSDSMLVIDTDIVTSGKFPITQTRGASNLKVVDGKIEGTHPTGLNYYGVLARANLDDGVTGGINPKNTSIIGTKFIGNIVNYIDVEGSITVKDIVADVNIPTNGGSASPIRLSASIRPTDLTVEDNTVMGAHDRGIFATQSPTRIYSIQRNKVYGHRMTGIQLRAESNLIQRNNDVDSAFTPFGYSGVIATAIQSGALVKDNKPNQTSVFGTYNISGDGSTLSFQIPHSLLAVPRRFDVRATNGAAGTATVDYVVPNATNITVRFKNAPASGTNNVAVNWEAEV
ncbi:hypothetical protein ACIQLG_19670 [Terribacillus saccharophilus]|uniref:hypothetical protein n=1 Tax=Terribacillus saccharophilus TaxID=361277 RepID=UPI0038161F83